MLAFALWHFGPLGGDLSHYFARTVVRVQLLETVALLLAVENVSREWLFRSLQLLRRGLRLDGSDVCSAASIVERTQSRGLAVLNRRVCSLVTLILLPQAVEVYDEVLKLFLVPERILMRH